MNRTPLAVFVAVCVALLSGCIYKVASREPLPSTTEKGDLRIAGVDLAGAGTIGDNGIVHVDLTMRGRCEQEVTVFQNTRVNKERSMGYLLANTITSGILGYGGLLGGIPLVFTGHSDIGVPLLVFAVGNGANVLRVTVFTKRSRSDVTKKRLEEKKHPAECTTLLAGRALDQTPAEVVLTPPWGAEARAAVTNRTAAFKINWAASGIDPLAADATARVQQPWRVAASDGSGEFTWTPDAAASEAALVAIGKATGTELTAAVGEAPPLLEIETLDTRGPLPAGQAVRTALTITNKGRGAAYRVVATTKSSDPALHGLRYSFGKIGPGESITKYLEVTVPRDHEDGKALVVVNVTEANGNVPDRFSQEVPIAHSGRPRLRVACDVTQGANKVNQTATVDAGRQLRLRCTVHNEGDGPAIAAQVDAILGPGGPKSSTTGDIASGAKGTFDVLLVVPPDAKTGQSWGLNVEARETNFGAKAAWSLPVEIGLMQICQPPIKRDAYERKLAEVRAMGLDAATLKAYEEQLVGCLGD